LSRHRPAGKVCCSPGGVDKGLTEFPALSEWAIAVGAERPSKRDHEGSLFLGVLKGTDDLLGALDEALLYRFAEGPFPALALRTDNGPQMTSRRFRGALAACEITHERTGYNNPDGEAYIERFFRTLKEEELWLRGYRSFAEASEAIARFIACYNAERPHQALGYRSPREFRPDKS
jgi:hypothetical protein